MKKVIAVIALAFIGKGTIAQVTINGGTMSNSGAGNITINTTAVNGAGELSLRATTTDNATDAFEIRNAGGGPSDGTFIPMLLGTRGAFNANSGLGSGSSLVLMGNIQNSTMDIATASPVISFLVRQGFVANTTTGTAINNRPLYQWTNGANPQMTMSANGSLGIGTTNPSARLHIWTNKSTLANEKISTDDMTLELGVAANNGEYNINKGDVMIWTNQTSSTPNLRGNIYLNTGNFSNTNRANSRNIILGPSNRNAFIVSEVGRVGIGLDNYNQPLTTITQPERLLHVNSRSVADIRFQNLPTRNCGFLLMVDANGDLFRTPMQGDPCMEACQLTAQPTPAFGDRFESLKKEVDSLKKELEALKSKLK